MSKSRREPVLFAQRDIWENPVNGKVPHVLAVFCCGIIAHVCAPSLLFTGTSKRFFFFFFFFFEKRIEKKKKRKSFDDSCRQTAITLAPAYYTILFNLAALCGLRTKRPRMAPERFVAPRMGKCSRMICETILGAILSVLEGV